MPKCRTVHNCGCRGDVAARAAQLTRLERGPSGCAQRFLGQAGRADLVQREPRAEVSLDSARDSLRLLGYLEPPDSVALPTSRDASMRPRLSGVEGSGFRA